MDVSPSAVTADGCPVEVYRRLPPLGEPELVHAWAGPGTTVLELGAGTGRIADPLVRLGHDVLAVDHSAEMLAAVRRARTHRSDIRDLRLDQRFDVVLLAGHLVNTPEEELRHGLLAAAARHLAEDGLLLVQRHPPEWFDGLAAGARPAGAVGGMTARLTVHALDGDLLTAEVRYSAGDRVWTQLFQARRLGDEDLRAAFDRAGLREIPLDPADRSWCAAILR